MMQKVDAVIGGKTLTIETGRFADQADGAVTVQYGDTAILVTVCVSETPMQRPDFLPLSVDYEERLYAAGKIPGGFLRREGRPSQAAILAARLVDRPIRPLFPKGFNHEVQIIITVLSADQENMPEVLAIIGTSAALSLSTIPFEGPIGAVRIGYLSGEFVVNPTFSQIQESLLDLVVVGTTGAVVMVEAGSKELSEEIILEAIKLGQEVNQGLVALQQELRDTCGKPKRKFSPAVANPAVEAALSGFLSGKLSDLLARGKSEREEGVSLLKEEAVQELGESYTAHELLSLFDYKVKAELRKSILDEGRRPDGRKCTEIRPISCGTGLLPRTHGSGLFTRGLTQVLTITTLGSIRDEQRLDGLSQEETKRFMHHYNFPPFSVGETKRVGTPGRREIGHGALVERALIPVIPKEADFPYTVRLVSEVLSSNGSSSMASVCASSLSLMDAGVPIKTPVGGVAMGVVTDEAGRYAILTDIAGLEDACGDMDFKVAGTAEGITALQLDIKLKGISYEVIRAALDQARGARLQILDKMQQTIAASRPELSKFAPRMIKISIPPHKIGALIGPGGKTIRAIIEETKASVDVEDDGTVLIGSANDEAAQKAIAMIEALTREVETGAIYTGKVTRIFNFGAMVEILPGKEGLVHISELADYKVPSVEAVVKVGDEVMVVVTDIDRQGRINLSRRAVFQGLAEAGGEAKAKVTDSPPAVGGQPPGRYSEARLPAQPPQRSDRPGNQQGQPRPAPGPVTRIDKPGT